MYIIYTIYENFIYPSSETAFVADIGGASGLFLGLSMYGALQTIGETIQVTFVFRKNQLPRYS